ncbi:hypothetical protein DXO203_19625 [Xanthomonas oryzae pv. oryzae]|nr:hypothetical protein DXO203_19625 [Xanthomonas oryzae pv. oryzae]
MRRADGRHRIKKRWIELTEQIAEAARRERRRGRRGRWQPGPGHRPPSGQAIQGAASRRSPPPICSRLNPIRLGSGQKLAGRTWRARTNGIHQAYLFTWSPPD